MYDFLEGYERLAAILFLSIIYGSMFIIWYSDEIKILFRNLFNRVFFFLKAGNKNKS